MSRKALVIALIVAVALFFLGVANYQGLLPWKLKFTIASTKKPAKKPAKKSKRRPARRSYVPSVPEVPQVPMVPSVPKVPSVPGVPDPPMPPRPPAMPDQSGVPEKYPVRKTSMEVTLIPPTGEKVWHRSGFLNGGKTRVEKTGPSVTASADVFTTPDVTGFIHGQTVFNGIKINPGMNYPE